MRSSKLRLPALLGMALVLGMSLSAAEKTAVAKKDVTGEVRSDIQERFRKQDARKVEAIKLRDEGRYDEAIRILDDILKELSLEKDEVEAQLIASRIDEFRRDLATVRKMRGAKFLTDARLAAADRKWSEARALAAGALEVPSLKSQAESLINYCASMEKQETIAEERSLKNIAPNHKADQVKVNNILNAARTFCKAKRYTEALNKIEEAYIVDPYNIEVIALAGEIYNKVFTYGNRRGQSDVEGMSSYAKWAWVEPVFSALPDADNTTAGLVHRSGAQDSMERLNKIVFKKVDFEGADVQSVINFIKDRNVVFDPDRKGVPINSSLNQKQADEIPPLNMSFTNIPLDVLLRYLCQMTGLKYRVDSDGSVFIGKEVDEMTRKNFVVRGNLIKNVIDEVAQGSLDASAVETAKTEASSSDKSTYASKAFDVNSTESTGTDSKGRLTVSQEDLKKYFTRRGVQFADGSSISYNPGKREIIARNTSKNLQRLEMLVNQNNTDSKLIMVEIKAIEIDEGDMQELGFHWTFGEQTGTVGSSGAWSFGQGGNTAPSLSEDGTFSYGSLSTNRGGFEEGFSGKTIDTKIIQDMNIFPALFGSHNPFGSEQGELNIGLTINALSRNDRSEALCAPKLITVDGKTAKLEVVRRYYFPQSWDTIEVEVETSDNSGSVTITPPVPSFSDAGDPIGIIFSCTPHVLDDNKTIQLDLNPKFTTYLGPDNWPVNIYGYIPKVSTFIDEQTGIAEVKETKTPYNYYFNVWRPITTRREMQVKLNVYDGETVVLGGIVQSQNTGRTDKMPILGDLPLIGRLFQSQADDISRTNLLIFVTARLMKNDGGALTGRQIGGEPDFNR